eukprot:7835019-Alexandrium_andersonii.AAC.1
MVRKGMPAVLLQPRTSAFAHYAELGRLVLVQVAITPHVNALVVVFYAFVRSAVRAKTAETSLMFEAIERELDAQAPQQVLLMGDLNAAPEDIVPLWSGMQTGRWVDLGALGAWDQSPNLPTALAHGASQPRRLDYVFASGGLLEHTSGFYVDQQPRFDVHKVLRFSFAAGIPKPKKRLVKPPKCDDTLQGEALQALRRRMSKKFERASDVLTSLLEHPSMDGFFRCWCECVESAWQP